MVAPKRAMMPSPVTTTTTPPPTTTTTIRCGQVPGVTPPTCGGDCPSPLACVNIAPAPNIQCSCETPCGLQGTTCTRFCPSSAQQCHPTATNPCGCCTITNASCTPGSTNECCG